MLLAAKLFSFWIHLYVEIYTETLAVMCAYYLFSKDCSQHLVFDYGHKMKAQNNMSVFMCANGCLWAYEYVATDKGLLAACSLTLDPHLNN